MEQVFEFAGNHPFLVASFFAILTAIVVVEVKRLQGGGRAVEPAEATQLYNKQNAVFIDIRADNEYRKEHLPGAIHLPGSALDDQHIAKLNRYKDRPVIVYCNTGLQSGRVAGRLRKAGFQHTLQLRGGLQAWQAAGFPLQSK